jgi:hypothetical protein
MTRPDVLPEVDRYILNYTDGHENYEREYLLGNQSDVTFQQMISELTPGTNYTIEGCLATEELQSDSLITHCSTCEPYNIIQSFRAHN